MTRKKKAQKNLAILQKSILDADGEANSFLSRNQTQHLEAELETKFQHAAVKVMIQLLYYCITV